MKSRLKDRRKDIVKLLAALHLRDAYAMRKLVRRIVPVIAVTALVMTASPSWAKKITDEELAAFLGRPVAAVEATAVKKVSAEKAAPAPAAKAAPAVPVVAEKEDAEEVTGSSFLSSKEGEHKTGKPKKAAKKHVVELPDIDPLEVKAEGQTLSVQGTVSGRNGYGLAVEYEVDPQTTSSKEMWFNLTKKTKLSGVTSLAEIQEGDTVSVTYKELKESKKKIMLDASLVQRKPKEVPVVENPTEAAGPMAVAGH